jgi:sarcosine oxidase subunit beta
LTAPADISDVAVIGGGMLGACTALNLARGGMKTVLLERGGICMQASGRNAGTLTLLYARDALLLLTLRGKAMWEDAPAWLGREIGHRHAPGLELAFTEAEAAALEAAMTRRQEWGIPVQLVGGNRAREIEPGLSPAVRLAGYSSGDGWASPNLVGGLLREALVEAGTRVMDGTAVTGIERETAGFAIRHAGGTLRARRLLIATNLWARQMLAWLGLPDVPIRGRALQVVVTERMQTAITSVVRVINQVSMKQTQNGTFLVGSDGDLGWIDDPDRFDGHLDPAVISQKMGIAVQAVPALRRTRVIRSWHGLEGHAPDNEPLVGPVPGVPGAYVMACMRSGWTIGPFAGKVMAQIMMDRSPEFDLFRPEFAVGRFAAAASHPAGAPA